MSCINPNQPIFKKILAKTNNPLGSELLYDRLMDIVKDEERYNKYAGHLSTDIANDIMLNSPSMKRVKDNVYEIVLHKDSSKILTLEQAYKVAEERLAKANKFYSTPENRSIGRITTNNGPVQVIIEPSKPHVINYIIDEMLKEEADKRGAASIQKTQFKERYTFNETGDVIDPETGDVYSGNKEPLVIAVKKAKEFNEVLKNIAKNIGVDVKFVDSLVSKHGMTLNGLFSVTKDLKGLIELSRGSNDDLALSEELSHAIIDGFDQLPVVQNILKLVKKEGYSKYLGDNLAEYEELYKGNKEMLIKEAAGKALSQALYDNFNKESESLLTKALKALWAWVTNKFSKVTPNMENDLRSALDELSITILGDKLSNAIYNKATSMASVKDKDTIKKSIRTDKYKEIIVNIKRNIGRLKDKLRKLDDSSEEYAKLLTAIKNAENNLASYVDSNNKLYVKDAVNELLYEIEDFINKYEGENNLPSATEFSQITKFLNSISKIPNVEVSALIARYNELQKKYVEYIANNTLDSKEHLDYDKLIEDEEDINQFQKSFGTLVNLKNKIAYTIGYLIKKAQISISSKQGDLYNDVRKHVDNIAKWASENNIPTSKMYNIFIQDYKGTTILTREYTSDFYTQLNTYFKNKNWEGLKNFAYKDKDTNNYIPYNKSKYINEDYTKIMSDKNLKDFYDFYKKTMSDSLDRLPENVARYKGDYFIPNIMMNDLSSIIEAKGFTGKLKNLAKYTTGIDTTNVTDKDLLSDEALERDNVPIKYLATITSDRKSRDLGESLFKFAAFTIEHEHLSEVLPQTRILQNAIADNKYISSTNSKVLKEGVDTNIYEMIDRFIDMQLRGNKKKDFAKIKIGDILDENGKVIGKKEIDLGDAIDFGLKWNSLLRIGLNPISAVTNVLVGEAGNIIETMGGRFFNRGDLTKASGIFSAQAFFKDSKFNHIIEKYPLMQELTDYEYAGRLSTSKGLNGEKVKNFMYKPQKAGEIFLQGRTMIAMMLNTKPDGKTSFWEMLDDTGNLKQEYKDQFEDFNDYMIRFSTKVLAVNEKIHGRYSERDAAIIQQNALWRMAFQFKKWVPAAIEARFESKRFDERLGAEVEGRWITVARMIKNLGDTANRVSTGQLTELERYNFRKVATEVVMILGSLAMYMALGWDDDDKRKKSAGYKFVMTQLDRVSGDLLFLANPENATAMTKNPIAMTKLVDDLWDTFKYTPYALYLGEYKYEAGPKKGENKFYSKLISLTPGAKSAQDVYRLFNEEKYRDYNP